MVPLRFVVVLATKEILASFLSRKAKKEVLVSYMRISCRLEAHKGCLVLSGVDSWGGVSEWDPERESWFRDEDSFIFPVASAAEGEVEVEVWNGRPDPLLPREVFSR